MLRSDSPQAKTNSEIRESSLVNRLLSRDETALSFLYDHYSAALYGVILKIIRCEYQAEDILQESFVKIWTSVAQYDPSKGRFFTWMLNICRNHAIDKTRSAANRKKLKTDELMEGQNAGSCNRTENHSNHIGIKEITEKLLPEQKAVIDMLYFGGFTQSEVAEQLELPLGTVKTRARKAISNLNKLLS